MNDRNERQVRRAMVVHAGAILNTMNEQTKHKRNHEKETYLYSTKPHTKQIRWIGRDV